MPKKQAMIPSIIRTMRRAIHRLLPPDSFIKNVGILTAGTIFAQGIMVLALPLLTRLYSPEHFDLLAVYVSLISLLTVGAGLRFNIAILLPENHHTAMDLLKLALISVAVISMVLALLVIFATPVVLKILHQPEFQPYLWMVPVGLFLAGSYDALQYWTSRMKRFALVTKTRMTRAIGGTGTQLAVGAAAPSPFGLIFGHMIYGGMGVMGLVWSLWRHDRAIFFDTEWQRLRQTAREYRRYPLMSVPEALLNTAGTELPVIIIAAAAAGPEAGFLMLAMRVMGLPMGLIGGSVAQVYLVEAPARLRNGTLAVFTRKTMWQLFLAGAPVLLLVGVASPFMFPLIFGVEWSRAGVILAWLTPWFILQFVTSPVSTVLHVKGKVRSAMILQLIGSILRIGSVLLVLTSTPRYVTEAFALSSAAFYLLYLVIVMRESEGLTIPCK